MNPKMCEHLFIDDMMIYVYVNTMYARVFRVILMICPSTTSTQNHTHPKTAIEIYMCTTQSTQLYILPQSYPSIPEFLPIWFDFGLVQIRDTLQHDQRVDFVV